MWFLYDCEGWGFCLVQMKMPIILTWLIIGLAGLLGVLFLVYGLGLVGGSRDQRRDGQGEPQ